MNRIDLCAVGVVALTVIEAVALWKNIDGTLLSMVVGTIGSIVGYAFGQRNKVSEK